MERTIPPFPQMAVFPRLWDCLCAGRPHDADAGRGPVRRRRLLSRSLRKARSKSRPALDSPGVIVREPVALSACCEASRAPAAIAECLAAALAMAGFTGNHGLRRKAVKATGQPGRHRLYRADHRDAASRFPGAQIAQLVEHATENRSVPGSNPGLGTILPLEIQQPRSNGAGSAPIGVRGFRG